MSCADAGYADAHIHLDFFADPAAFARDARVQGLSLFANSVTPQGYERTHAATQGMMHVHAGLGQHPWWVEQADLERLDQLLPRTRWVGEVGLDFSPKRPQHERQAQVFEHIADQCACAGNKVLSIHSVRAADAVLDVLEETGCTATCTCIFHWFSGSTEALWRAIHAGCWFSVNQMQANTRRAKEQLKLIPRNRLLLETDLPPAEDATTTVDDVLASLERTRVLLEEIRGEQLAAQLQDNWLRLS